MPPVTMRVKRIIAHLLPHKHTQDKESIVLAEVDTPPDDAEDTYRTIERKITESLGENCLDSEIDGSCDTPVHNLVNSVIFNNGENFISLSQEVAVKFYELQRLQSLPATVLIATGSLGLNPALAVMKLQMTSEMAAQPQLINGKRVNTILEVSNLVALKTTKIVKLGLFLRDAGIPLERGLEGIIVRVSDYQKKTRNGQQAAQYFGKTFLGCRPKEAPAVLLERWYTATKEWINDDVKNPQSRVDYGAALFTEVRSPNDTVSPVEFARLRIREEDRDNYIAALGKSNAPVAAFPKDNSSLAPRLANMTVSGVSGLVLTGSPEAFKEKVRISTTEGGEAHIEFVDELKDIGSKR